MSDPNIFINILSKIGVPNPILYIIPAADGVVLKSYLYLVLSAHFKYKFKFPATEIMKTRVVNIQNGPQRSGLFLEISKNSGFQKTIEFFNLAKTSF